MKFLAVRAWTLWRMGDLFNARRRIDELKGRLGADMYRRMVSDWGFLEGLLLMEEDRLAEARAAFERNAQSLQALGWEGDALRSKGLACFAACEEGKVDIGRTCLDELGSSIQASKMPAFAGAFWLRRGRTECFLAARRFEDAKASLDQGWGALIPPFPASMEITRARVEVAEGRQTAALARLRRTLKVTEEKRWALQRLETELALGETELRVTRERGRARLAALQTEASRMGFLRIARLAREAVDGTAAGSR